MYLWGGAGLVYRCRALWLDPVLSVMINSPVAFMVQSNKPSRKAFGHPIRMDTPEEV